MNNRIFAAAAIAMLALPAIAAPPDHLLISEVGSRGGFYISGHESPEFLEIYNPTASAVSDLANYYVSDWSQYWRYPDYVRQGTLPNEGGADHVAHFPAEAPAIPAGGIVTVTANAKQFLLSYFDDGLVDPPVLTDLLALYTSQPGSPKLYEMFDSMPEVPDMVNKNGDETENSTNLGHTDTGENVFLFYYDGTSDLVQDVDMVLYKKRAAILGTENGLYPKSEPVDGPDVDEVATSYFPDNGDEDNLSVLFTDASPYQTVRRLNYEPGEPATGGNGLNGSDETMEFAQVSFLQNGSSAEATPGIAHPGLTAADQKPAIFAAETSPAVPASNAPFTISAQIHDDGSVASANVYISDSITTITFPMTAGSGETWTATIPANTFPDRTSLSWYIVAQDNTANITSEWEYADFGTIGDPVIHALRVDNTPPDGKVVFNEIMFDPQSGDNSTNPEFIELYNSGSTSYDLSGYYYQYQTGALVELPSGTTIGANDYLVLAFNIPLLTSKYSIPLNKVVQIEPSGTGSKIANSGTGTIRLIAWDAATELDTVSYRVTSPWPGNTVSGSGYAASNTGYSIELLDPTLDNNDGANWIASSQPGIAPAGGTPGMNNFSIDCVRDIVSPTPADPITITALVAGVHPASNVQLTYTANGGLPVTVPMVAVPSSNNFSYTIPAQAERTFISYNVTAEDAIDSINITANPIDYSFMVSTQPMLSEENIVITEILPDPSGSDNGAHSEFVEFYNRTGSPINMGHALIGPDNANAVALPEGFILPPYGYGVLAGNLASFMIDYPTVDPNIVVAAGWTVTTLGQTGSPARAVIIDPNQVQINRTNFPADIVNYGIPGDGWPYASGQSMMLIDINMNNNAVGSWENGPDGGTPGQASAVSDWSVY